MVPTNTTSTTGDGRSSQRYSDLKEDLRKSGEELSQTVKGQRKEVSQKARGEAESAKGYAADEMEDFSHAAEAAADTLRDEHHETLSSYVSDIAGHVGNMAESLRNRSADDLVSDAKRLAHRNPSLFIAGGIALGLGIARIAKSGTHDSRAQPDDSSFQSTGSFTSTGANATNSGYSNTGSSFGSNGNTASGNNADNSSTTKGDSLNPDVTQTSNQYDKV